MATLARVTQAALEAMQSGGSPNARLTQLALETLQSGGSPNAHLTQVALESLTRVGQQSRQHNIGKAGSSTGNFSLSLTQNITAGDLLLAAGGWNGSGVTAAITDSQGNVWTPVSGSAAYSPAAGNVEIWWTIAGVTGADTVTMTTSASATQTLNVREYASANGWPLNPVNAVNTGTGSGSNFSVAITTPSNSVIFTFVATGSNVTFTAGTGYTPADTTVNAAGTDATNQPAGSYTPTVTGSASTSYAQTAVAVNTGPVPAATGLLPAVAGQWQLISINDTVTPGSGVGEASHGWQNGYQFWGPYLYNAHLYVMMEGGTGPNYRPLFWKSGDNGFTWTQLSQESTQTWYLRWYSWTFNPQVNSHVFTFFIHNDSATNGPAVLIEFDLATETWGAAYATSGGPAFDSSGSARSVTCRLSTGRVRVFYKLNDNLYWAEAQSGAGSWLSANNLILAGSHLAGGTLYFPYAGTVDASDKAYVLFGGILQPAAGLTAQQGYVTLSSAGSLSTPLFFGSYTQPASSTPGGGYSSYGFRNIIAPPDGNVYVSAIDTAQVPNVSTVEVLELSGGSWTRNIIASFDQTVANPFYPYQVNIEWLNGAVAAFWTGAYPNSSYSAQVHFATGGPSAWTVPQIYWDLGSVPPDPTKYNPGVGPSPPTHSWFTYAPSFAPAPTPSASPAGISQLFYMQSTRVSDATSAALAFFPVPVITQPAALLTLYPIILPDPQQYCCRTKPALRCKIYSRGGTTAIMQTLKSPVYARRQ